MLEMILIIINTGIISLLYGYIILAVFGIFVHQMMKDAKVSVNCLGRIPIWLLAISGFIYAIFASFQGRSLIGCMVYYFILPLMVFMTGYVISSRNRDKVIIVLGRCLTAIAIGVSIHVLLNITVNLNIRNRNETADFFEGSIAATNLGSLNTYIFALLPCLIITKNKKIKIGGFIVFLLSVIYAFLLGTRTTLYAFIIMSIMSAIIYIRRHYSKGIKFSVLLKWAGAIACVVSITMLIYYADLFDIQTSIKTSMLAYRYQTVSTRLSDGVRWSFFKAGITYLFEHPLGGNQINGIRYFHNYWLDVARVAGIIPFMIIIVFDIILIKHMAVIFKCEKFDEDFRYALLGIYICVFINFFVEPIMDGYLDLFYRFTLINGMVEGSYDIMCRNPTAYS